MGFARESEAYVAKNAKNAEKAPKCTKFKSSLKNLCFKHVFEHAGQNANHFKQTLVLIW